MNIQLNHKSKFYELFIDKCKIIFILEEISTITIRKKFNFNYIIYYLLLLFFLYFFWGIFLDFFFFFLNFFYINFIIYFIYKPRYEIELVIGNDSFLFETIDKGLFEEFEILKFLYDEMKNE